nr:translocation/assembly module TamB domain-containing protein [Aquabacterium sp. A08]
MGRATGWLLGLLGAAAALLAALGLSAWLWSASPQSLTQTLQWASDWLAEGDERPLTVEGVSGTLRTGGTVERLRWQRDGLTVELQGLALRWPAQLWTEVLLQRRLTLETATVAQLRVRDERPPQPPEPLRPPDSLALPWLAQVGLRLQIDALWWDTDRPVRLGPLRARYDYTRPGDAPDAPPEHRLDLQELAWQGGHYTLQARVQALAPMALHATLSGRLLAERPGHTTPLPLQADATLQGNLAGPEAALQLQAEVRTGAQPAVASAPPALQAQATLRPWAPLPVRQADLTLAQLDLASLWPGAPRTRLGGRWQVRSGDTPADASTPAQALATSDWRLAGNLHNDLPGPWDRQRLPVSQLDTELRWQAGQWHLPRLQAQAAGGTLQAQGRVRLADGQPAAWEGTLQAQGVRASAVLSTLAVQAFDLDLKAQQAATSPADTMAPQTTATLALRPAGPLATARELPAPQLQASGRWQAGALTLDTLALRALDAQVQASGTLQTQPPVFDGQVQLDLPGLNARFDGIAATPGPTPARTSAAQIALRDATALHRWLLQTVQQLQRAWPQAPWTAPVLQALRPLDVQGEARLDAHWQTPPPWFGPGGPGPAAPWSLRLSVPRAQLRSADPAGLDLALRDWQADGQGQGTDWQLRHSGQSALGQGDGRWQTRHTLALDGQLRRDPQGWAGQARVQQLELQAHSAAQPLGARVEATGQPLLQWLANGDLSLQPGGLRLQPVPSGSRALPPMAAGPLTLAWSTTRWTQGRWEGQGQLQGLALSWLNAALSSDAAPQGPLPQAGLVGDLLFDGQWDLSLPLTPAAASGAPARARLQLQRASGDLSLLSGSGPQAERLRAGLQAASLAVGLDGTALQGRLRWDSQQAGQVQAELHTTLDAPQPQRPHWNWPAQAPLRGQLQAQLPQIGLWSSLAPPGWRLSGRLQADATLAGTREQPAWQGRLQASELALRSLLDGLEFSDGELQASLSGETLTIDRLRLRGAGGGTGGWLTGQGTATWPLLPGTGAGPREPAIDLRLQAERLRLLARADRRLTLSGDVQAQLRGPRLDLSGRLTADQALFLLPDETTPRLGSDVVVRGTERPPGFGAGSPVRTQVRLEFLLGDDFRVRGLGLDTYLSGRLQIAATPPQSTPQLTGQVQTVRGSYRAYGQALNIEQGRIRFNGPVDNPTLDILALRPHPSQRVGVAIGGTAQAPRVRLYAEPDMPDSEKLAWLVLGRPASGAGAEAAVLQQAALALLSGSGSANDGSLTRALGLDELSLQGESTNADGSTRAAALTLGKRISNELYVSYSRSVTGALGTVAVFYDLSRYLTLRAQAGDDNAIDLVFTHTFDGRALPPRTRNGDRPAAPEPTRTIAPTSP